VWKREKRRPIGRWKVNIKMDLKGNRMGGLD
jgi:hypothetical protein